MSGIQLEIQLIAVVVAVACALPGVFLVLRRMALMSDAISHTVLLGIVLGFFVIGDITSPALVLAAAGMGVMTVALVELVRSTGLVKEDASIGIVFPALFSAAVILIGLFAGDVHLDTDAVLLGEIAFAPFRRFTVAGLDLGPRALWLMSGILLLDLAFIIAFYKELKLSTFDPALAAALGFSPALLHYAFMGLVSITAVGAFDSVGSILVVALMIAPPAAAYLLTDRLPLVLALSALLGGISAVAGFWLAVLLDASIAGSMALMAGATFAMVVLLAPERGLVAAARRRRRQKREFSQMMLLIHLLHHEDTAAAETESRETHLRQELRWTEAAARRIVDDALEDGLIRREDGRLLLTEQGRERAREAMFVSAAADQPPDRSTSSVAAMR